MIFESTDEELPVLIDLLHFFRGWLERFFRHVNAPLSLLHCLGHHSAASCQVPTFCLLRKSSNLHWDNVCDSYFVSSKILIVFHLGSPPRHFRNLEISASQYRDNNQDVRRIAEIVGGNIARRPLSDGCCTAQGAFIIAECDGIGPSLRRSRRDSQTYKPPLCPGLTSCLIGLPIQYSVVPSKIETNRPDWSMATNLKNVSGSGKRTRHWSDNFTSNDQKEVRARRSP